MEVRFWAPLGNGARVLCLVDPIGTLEGVPEIGFSGTSLLNTACNLKFVFLCVFPNNELEPLGMDGGSKEALSVSPSPRPCVQGQTCSPRLSKPSD